MATKHTSGDGAPTEPRRVSPRVTAQELLPAVEVEGAGYWICSVNAAFCRLLGRSQAELMGTAFATIAPGGQESVAELDRVYEVDVPPAPSPGIEADPPLAQWLYALWPAAEATDLPVGVIIARNTVAAFRKNAAAINEALLLSALRQHELTASAVTLNAQLAAEIAERKVAEAALHEANRRLADQAGELERLVAVRTEKLRETVGELEGFSYSVAHDLRGPLRGVEGFARILLNDHAAQLDAAGHGYLENIAKTAGRVNRLVQEVLNYTQVLRATPKLTSVDLAPLVRDLIAAQPDWQPPAAEIRIEGMLPRVLGHESLLTQCISNLLENAVKFVAPGVAPRVRISAAVEAAWVRVVFEDNGIGIAAEERDRVCRRFERLHPVTHFDGTGLGLTIARKAVERMGGRLDFASEPGRGSRFWLDLLPAPVAPLLSPPVIPIPGNPGRASDGRERHSP